MNMLVNASHLKKSFNSHLAVDDVSFGVNRGEVLAFLGPNGAGKTTTMRMLTGFLQPDSGMVSIDGTDFSHRHPELKEKIGYLPEGGPLYQDMRVVDFLNFIASVRLLDATKTKTRLDYVCQVLGLEEIYTQTIETLSKGFKRRVALAQALLHDPDILVLDEPTDGLDPIQTRQVQELITSIAKDKAIILSTHILNDVELLCQRAVILKKGNIVATGTIDALKEQHHKHTLTDVFFELMKV